MTERLYVRVVFNPSPCLCHCPCLHGRLFVDCGGVLMIYLSKVSGNIVSAKENKAKKVNRNATFNVNLRELLLV